MTASTISWSRPSFTTADLPKPEGAYFDEQAVSRAVNFLRLIRHVDGQWAGQPFELQEWQYHEIIAPLYGWRRSDGSRLYRQAYVEIPRKAGKSTLASAIALYGLVADGEPGAQVVAGARDRPQARLVFDMARRMVEGSPELSKRCVAKRSYIEVPSTGSVFRAISADAGSQHGLSISTGVLDEIHAHRGRDLFDVISTSQGARQQPLLFNITTAGVFDVNSIAWELHDHTIKTAEGTISDPGFLGVIYGAEKDDDWTDPKIWRKANPGMGITVSEEWLSEQVERAKQIPARQTVFKQLHMNIWTQEASRWLDMGAWDECAGDKSLEEFEASLEGESCWAGLDLSSTTDTTALVLAFPQEDGTVSLITRVWLPDAGVLERERRDRVPYRVWSEQGLIRLTPGNVIDYDEVRAELHKLSQRYVIAELAFDRWGSAQLVQELAADGLNVVQTGQGFASLSAPTKELERLVLSRKLIHGGHAVLRAHADAVTVENDASGNVKPTKAKSNGRIDAVVAAVMAVGAAQLSDQGAAHSAYEEEGLMVL
jgi:phage terminase large subunit-like protein